MEYYGRVECYFNDKRYGFIRSPEFENDVFCHWTSIKSKKTYKNLEKGDWVSFEIEIDKQERNRARNVMVVDISQVQIGGTDEKETIHRC